MFPTWIKPALLRSGILAAACILLSAGVAIVSGSIRKPLPVSPLIAADARDTPAMAVPVATSDPAIPIKQIEKASPKALEPASMEPKLISLYEAVGLLEKTGKGEVIAAEKVGEGDRAIFNLGIVNSKGSKTYFNVNATGKVIVEVPPPLVKKGGNKKGR